MNWNDLRVFLALARSGSMRSAAIRLSVSHSTVVRRIDALETALGVRLFERSPLGYTLTPVGEAMLEQAEQVENDVHRLELSILGQDAKLSGAIRVTMADALIQFLLAPDLQRFKLAYPDIDLEIIASYDIVDLTKREADVAIRFMSNPPDYLVGHRLPDLNISYYASPEYLEQHDLNADPPTANWVGMDEIAAFPTAQWLKDSPYPHIPVRWNLPMGSQHIAARAGLGMVMLPCYRGDQDTALRRIPPGKVVQGKPGWVLTLDDLRTTERVRVLVTFIAKAIRQHADLLEGRCPREVL
ncbi:MAG: LysR family transcriptional regulator [Leptolyngbyaceae cyanobacterium MO_188.B28]|nr:LysR family transcriptional regulator [Leptolyngbyaceae cyanobacterium MO_188.B28]